MADESKKWSVLLNKKKSCHAFVEFVFKFGNGDVGINTQTYRREDI